MQFDVDVKEAKKTTTRMLFESFLVGCCETASRAVFILPEGSNIFRKIGKELICGVISQKTAEYVSEETYALYSDLMCVKEAILSNEDKKGEE